MSSYLNVGNVVRVAVGGNGEMRKAVVGFVDEDDGTADVFLERNDALTKEKCVVTSAVSNSGRGADSGALHGEGSSSSSTSLGAQTGTEDAQKASACLDDEDDELSGVPFSKIKDLLPFERQIRNYVSEHAAGKASTTPGKIVCADNFYNNPDDQQVVWGYYLQEAQTMSGVDVSSSALELIKIGSARIKDEGNQLFKLKDYAAAHGHYSFGISSLQSVWSDASHVLIRGGEELKVIKNTPGKQWGEAERKNLVFVHDVTTLAALYMRDTSFRYMNRARCLAALKKHQEAGFDLGIVIGLYEGQSRESCGGLERLEKLSKAYYLRAKARLERKKWDAAKRDIESGLALDHPSSADDFLKLDREMELMKKRFVQGNKKIAKEIAKWADTALDNMAAGGAQ